MTIEVTTQTEQYALTVYRRPHFYILVGTVPMPVDDVIVWGRWFKDINNRRIAEDMIGDVWISTVFLGLDHAWGDDPPLLFETMAFRGGRDLYQDRCGTWQEAQAMHQRAVAHVRAAQEETDERGTDDDERT
jgi:hypothetical protein